MGYFGKRKNVLNLGFTIVELLVVIVVIGILASITIISYSGVSKKAIEASIQSDIANAAKQLKVFQATDPNEYYPATINCALPDSATNKCIKSSSGLTFVYSPQNGTNPRTFTLDATKSGLTYRITNDSSPVSITILPVTAIAAVSGSTSIGSVLSSGAITPAAATVNYQWSISSIKNGTYVNIPGATSNTYTLLAGDVGKFVKLTVTGTGDYTGSQISAPTLIAVPDNNWIAGKSATPLAGIYVRNADLAGGYTYKTSASVLAAPQGQVGLDVNYPSNMALVSPQIYPAVDFSLYPAQNACKAIGGRLPTVNELQSMYSDKTYYGGNFKTITPIYWSGTNVDNLSAYDYDMSIGAIYSNDKTSVVYVRCVAG